MELNRRAAKLVDRLVEQSDGFRIHATQLPAGTMIVDCGINSPGGLEAGLQLARICLSGLAQVSLVSSNIAGWNGPCVQVHTDHPQMACMASQYAGWQITGDNYFAMGSGPMRASAGKESLFKDINYHETTNVAVGVLESRELPPEEVCAQISKECQLETSGLKLLVAPTGSFAGAVQVVARSVETALHKLHELDFDLSKIRSGWGTAPLPPVGTNDLVALGRTNDAVLYGGDVVLWIESEDDELASIGPRVPSDSSNDYGRPFLEIFEQYDRDFYKIDPGLFSPAQVTLINIKSGRIFQFGNIAANLLRRSFGS